MVSPHQRLWREPSMEWAALLLPNRTACRQNAGSEPATHFTTSVNGATACHSVSAPSGVQAGFHPPRYAALLRPSSPSFGHGSECSGRTRNHLFEGLLLDDELRHSPAQTRVFHLEPAKPLHLIRIWLVLLSRRVVIGPPSVISALGDPDLPNRVGEQHAFPDQRAHVAQLGCNLLRCVPPLVLSSRSAPSVFRRTRPGVFARCHVMSLPSRPRLESTQPTRM